MTTPTNLPRLAVFIDAENVGNPSFVDLVFEKISSAKLGDPVLKRVYGNPDLLQGKKWVAACEKHALDPVQQDHFVSGKNSADVKIVVDAMHLRSRKGKGRIDVFCFVSSDTDFRPLVEFISIGNRKVFGFGRDETPPALKEVFGDGFFSFEELQETRYQIIRDEAVAILKTMESISLGYVTLSERLRKQLGEELVPIGFSHEPILKSDCRFNVDKNVHLVVLRSEWEKKVLSLVRDILVEPENGNEWVPVETIVPAPECFRLLPVLNESPSLFETRFDANGAYVRLAEKR